MMMNFYIPKNDDFNKLAVILPGYVSSKDDEHLTELGKFLTTKNYLGVSFNPTGTWGEGEDINKYNISQYLLDIDEVINKSKEKFERNFSEIVILGHSLGGKVSLLYAARNKNINKVVAIMPPTVDSAIKWVDGIRVSKRDNPINKDQIIEFKVPFSFIEDSLKYNVCEEVSKISCPVLLIAGQLDEKVLPEKVESIYKKVNEPKKYVLIEGVGHDYRFDKNQVGKVNEEIGKFISGT